MNPNRSTISMISVNPDQERPPYKAEWVYADQPLVDSLLAKNTRNRPLKPSHVQWFSEIAKGKNWLPTPDAIAVSKSGFLLNCQHRLEGIKTAGYPRVPLLLVTGLPDESMAAIDRGISRTMRDVLSLLLSEKVSGKLIAALAFFDRIKKGNLYGPYKSHPDDLLDLIEKHQDLIIDFLRVINSQRAPVSAAIMEYGSRNREKALAFANQLLYGENLVKEDPAYKLREELKKMEGGGTFVSRQSYRLAVAACIKHAKGKSAKSHPSETDDWSLFPASKEKK
jgi:hypothetical protein